MFFNSGKQCLANKALGSHDGVVRQVATPEHAKKIPISSRLGIFLEPPGHIVRIAANYDPFTPPFFKGHVIRECVRPCIPTLLTVCEGSVGLVSRQRGRGVQRAREALWAEHILQGWLWLPL